MKHHGLKNAEAQKGFEALIYQLLETELGGVQVYQTALKCVQHDELKEEFQKYLTETQKHVEIARNLLETLGYDPDQEVPARLPCRVIAQSLVKAMETALKGGSPEEAQLTATECVVHAETKDHMSWELIGVLAKKMKGDFGKTLKEAHEQVEKEEDHHIYHTTGWVRELWIQGLGLPAVLPPPEEEKDVETAIGAARAKNAREQML
jgi:hypothetical protein